MSRAMYCVPTPWPMATCSATPCRDWCRAFVQSSRRPVSRPAIRAAIATTSGCRRRVPDPTRARRAYVPYAGELPSPVHDLDYVPPPLSYTAIGNGHLVAMTA